jgi:hypothetical protein
MDFSFSELLPTHRSAEEEQSACRFYLRGERSLATKDCRSDVLRSAIYLPRGFAIEGNQMRLKLVDPVSASAGIGLHPETALISTIKTLPDNLNPHVLHEKYVVEGLSVKQIAHQFASSKSGVLAALKRAEIPIRASHQTHGRPANPPYGKRITKGKLTDCSVELKVIRLVKKMAEREKLSIRAIARKLTEMDIKTRRGHSRWHHEMIRTILKRNA